MLFLMAEDGVDDVIFNVVQTVSFIDGFKLMVRMSVLEILKIR